MWSLQLLQPRRLAGGNTGDGTESAENMMEDGGSEEKKKKKEANTQLHSIPNKLNKRDAVASVLRVAL